MPLVKSIVLLIIFITQINASTLNNPPPPKNFSWSNSGPHRSNFLLPKNWFLNIKTHKNVYKITISKEDSTKKTKYETAFTADVIKNVKKTTELEPTAYAKRFVNHFYESIKYKTNGMPYNKPSIKQEGDFRIYTIRFKDDISIMHHVLLANNKKDILYMILFESPESQWNKNYRIGKIILENMIIDDEL